jgi:protein TonB
LENPEPPFSPAALRQYQEGSVLVTVKVNAQGHVLHVEIKSSSGIAFLEEAALQAVRYWEFKPARNGPLAVESEVEVPVQFQLKE